MKKDKADGHVFEKMKELVEEYYSEPEKITMTATQSEAEARADEIDLEEYGPEESDEDDDIGEVEEPREMNDVDDEGDDIIVIDD